MKKIGFIGTGVMGFSMVLNLVKHGYEVQVYNRTIQKALPLKEYGVKVCSSIKECVSNVDVVITIVGYPKDVKEVYAEIFKYAQKQTIAIDMTTSSPSLAQELYLEGQKCHIDVLDAPVSGGDTGAKNGTLSIMVGGDEAIYHKVEPIFKAMGQTINYMGKAGFGQHTKMANQIVIAGTIGACNEAIIYAKKMGLDPKLVYDAISKGAASSWQLTNNGLKMIEEDTKPGFYIKHFIKDMKLADNEACSINLDLNILKDVLAIYEKLADQGLEDLGTQAIYKYYENK